MPDTEEACVGLLTNLFRKRPGVVRSLHPTHSMEEVLNVPNRLTDKPYLFFM